VFFVVTPQKFPELLAQLPSESIKIPQQWLVMDSAVITQHSRLVALNPATEMRRGEPIGARLAKRLDSSLRLTASKTACQTH
jgi:hypothetical protein